MLALPNDLRTAEEYMCTLFSLLFFCLPVWDWDSQDINSWDISRTESMNCWKEKEERRSWYHNRHVSWRCKHLCLLANYIVLLYYYFLGGIYLKRMKSGELVSRVLACDFVSVGQSETIPQTFIDTRAEERITPVDLTNSKLFWLIDGTSTSGFSGGFSFFCASKPTAT